MICRTGISVLIADDDDLLRDGLSYLIEAQPDLTVVGQARDGEEAIAVAGQLHPDVVVMDIRMPRLDGIEATRRIKARPDPPRILILTVFGQDDYVYEAFRSGADGFVLKRVRSDELHAAIRTVSAGQALISPAVTRGIIDRYVTQRPEPVDLATRYALTDREIDVLAQLAVGHSNDDIARRLDISDHTVKTHLSSIYAKTGCTSRVQAVILAYDTGLAHPNPPPARELRVD